MTNEITAMIFSLVGMVVTIASFQAAKKPMVMLLQSIGSTFYLISYAFLGGGIAVILNVIFLIRNAIYAFLDCSRGRLRYVLCAVLCASYAVSYSVYTLVCSPGLAESLWNLAPVGAALFGTVGSVCVDVNKYRAWKYGDSICWLTFNLHTGIGALGGILGEIFNLVSLTVGILRFHKKQDGTNG